MLRIGSFVPADLTQAPDFNTIKDALRRGLRIDLAFRHAAPLHVAHVPGGMLPGVNVFGPGRSPAMTDNVTATSATREVASVLLHDACLIDSCMAILDRHDRLFASGVENIGGAARLPAIDAHFRLDDTGEPCLAEDVRAHAPRLDLIGLPVCGAGFPNYGHFLYDGLPAVFMLHHLLAADPRVRVVGQPLRPWQREILAALELEQSYLEVTRPVVLDAVLASTLLSMHVSYPTPFIRPMFDFVRFRLGAAAERPNRKLFFSRAGDTRRLLRNRAAVEECAARLGFEIVRPERLSFREQVALMSSCGMVVGESGAAFANLGFCAPGTIVLEIQPERFVEGWVRGMCFMFGHRWHVYFASVDSSPSDAGAEEGHRFSYEIDVDDLERVVREVEQHMTMTPAVPPSPVAADPGDVRLVTNLEGFGTGPFLQQIDVFAGAMSPPPVRMLVSGDAQAAVPPDHYYRRQLPPVSLYAVPGHTLGGVGLLLGPDRALFARPDCLPAPLRERLAGGEAPAEWLGALLRPDAVVREVATPCVVPFQAESSYADFLVDVLPRLFLFATLQRLGRRFPLALSRDTPEWMRRIAALYASEAETIWYDPAREVVRAPAFIVPAMMSVDRYLHPAANLMVADLIERFGAPAPAGGARLYLSYRAFQDGHLSHLDNEEELAAILRDLGFRTLQPWRMTLAEQLAAYRDAGCIVSEQGAAACNALFAPHGAKVAVIGRPEGVLRRICGLRSHLLGIVEPDGGFPDHQAARYRVEPARFRAFMAQLLDEPSGIVAATNEMAAPAAAQAAAPQRASAVAPEAGVEALPSGRYLWTLAEAPDVRSVVFAESEHQARRAFFHATPIDPALAPYAGRFSDPAYRAYRTPRMGCVALAGAAAIGATGLICHAGQLVRDSMHSVDDWRPESPVAQRDMDRGVRFKRRIALPGRRLEGPAFCAISGGWRNHAHWLTETLPRLYLFRWLRAQVPDLRLLVPDYGTSAVHERTLQLLGIDPARVVRLADAEAVTPATLWSTPVIDLWSLPRLCQIAAVELAACVGNAAPGAAGTGPGGERIYLRRVQGARRLANFDDVAPLLENFGFRVLAMESMTLDEQIRTMQRARYIVGEHGAGVANIMFCRPGARVLELFNPVCPQPAHWVLASLCDLEYGYVVGRHVPTAYRPDPDWNADYAIAPEDFLRALRATLGEYGGD